MHTSGPFAVDQQDLKALQAAFQANPNDVGVGLCNPSTGEIRLGSFDTVTGGQGHQGLANALGIMNNGEWRGFVVSSDGRFVPTSHFNLPDGGLLMNPGLAAQVQRALQQAGLVR
jgi:hypothetical protein